MALKGRCECGLLLTLAAQYPEDHVECNGLRRCRRCLDVKPLATGFGKWRRICKTCKAADHLAYCQRRMAEDEAYREAHRESSRLWNKRAYAEKPGFAERMKARNKLRYRTDPEYAEAVRARNRRAACRRAA